MISEKTYGMGGCYILQFYGKFSNPPCPPSAFFVTFAKKTDMQQDINRIKAVLAEKKKTNKWLASQLGKDPATISKWCHNKLQPSLPALAQAARFLNVQPADLLFPTTPQAPSGCSR